MQKILIVDIGFLPSNNRVPILSKIKFWKKNGSDVSLICTDDAKKLYESHIADLKYYLIQNSVNPSSRYLLISELLKRNVQALLYLRAVKGSFDVVYSLSAVLDLVIFPYVLKFFDKRFKWCVVFDNSVKLPAVKMNGTHLLAYIFFVTSVLLIKRADTVFTVTQELKDFLISKKFTDTQLMVTGNAVETDLIKLAKRDENLGIDALYIGRLNEAKGIYDLLKVADIVRNSFVGFKLAIVGAGDKETEDKFYKKIEELKLSDNVLLLGYKSGIEKFVTIKSSKVFLFLSHDESFGVALLEAVCSGIKAIAYNLPVFRKIYLNNEVVLVPENDYLSVAENVIEIIESRNFENHPGSKLLERFSWNSIAALEESRF